jgi:Na+/H+-translocating membrane pyrophosphatase
VVVVFYLLKNNKIYPRALEVQMSIWLWVVVALCVLAVGYVTFNYFSIKKMEEGTDRMVELSAIIRSGANVFIKKEFFTIGIVVLIIAILFTLFIEKIPTGNFSLHN